MTNENETANKADMPHSVKNVAAAQMTVEEWLAIRKEAALHIDPETAEVTWIYAQTVDPYGVHPEPPDEYWQVGREYFARSPGSDVWVLREGRRRCLNACGQPLENAIFKTSLTSPAH